jgi:hypothetical protein
MKNDAEIEIIATEEHAGRDVCVLIATDECQAGHMTPLQELNR